MKIFNNVDWQKLTYTAVANQDLESQEEFHFQYWLKPIEEKLTTTVTEFVYQFVKKFDLWKKKCLLLTNNIQIQVWKLKKLCVDLIFIDNFF